MVHQRNASLRRSPLTLLGVAKPQACRAPGELCSISLPLPRALRNLLSPSPCRRLSAFRSHRIGTRTAPPFFPRIAPPSLTPRTVLTLTAFPRYFPASKSPSARSYFASSRSHTDNCLVCTCTGSRVAYRTGTACPLPFHRRPGPPCPSSAPRVPKPAATPAPLLTAFFDPDFCCCAWNRIRSLRSRLRTYLYYRHRHRSGRQSLPRRKSHRSCGRSHHSQPHPNFCHLFPPVRSTLHRAGSQPCHSTQMDGRILRVRRKSAKKQLGPGVPTERSPRKLIRRFPLCGNRQTRQPPASPSHDDLRQ